MPDNETDFSPRGDIYARLIGNVSNLPSIQIGMSDESITMDVILSAGRARHLGYMLIALSSEADTQAGYITTLRSHKLEEEEIMDIVGTAAAYIAARRMQ